MLKLLRDDLDRMTVEDVENFLRINELERERPPEGVLIDYKDALSGDLGGDVAAMANTYGGIILLGVKSERIKHNVPVSLPGLPVGKDGDLKARLTDKILSSVHPRPPFDIGIAPVGTEGRAIAVIRIHEGRIPPYEFNQGATIQIPVRIQDTNRQATVKEMESLFAKRERATQSPDTIASELRSRRDVCAGAMNHMGIVPPSPGHRVSVIPRLDLRLPVDSQKEIQFETLVHAFFPDAVNLASFRRGNFTLIYSEDVLHQKTWEVWSSGAVSLSAHFEPHGAYLGEIVSEFLRTCLLARTFLSHQDYMGYVILEHELRSGPTTIYSGFPQLGDKPAKGEIGATRAGLEIPNEKKQLQSESARSTLECAWADFDPPQDLVTKILLEELRETRSARIDFKTLYTATNDLAHTLWPDSGFVRR